MASKSSKNSVEINNGRSEILQQFTVFEKLDQLSPLKKKIQQLSTVGQLSTKKNATVDLSPKVDRRLQFLERLVFV
jgi:hypothetical protein